MNRLLLLLVLCCGWPVYSIAQVTAFENGAWFDGQGFTKRAVYGHAGMLHDSTTETVTERVNLEGHYVVPAFGEAHNHDLASDHEIGQRIARYLWDGVFYAKMQSAFSTSVPREHLNHPRSVDVTFAFAPVTGPGGHPIRLRHVGFDRGWYQGVFETKEEIAGIGYTLVEDAAHLEQQWPLLLAQRPDFIKFMLSWSEEYALRRDDEEFFGRKGLDPALAPRLVELAHDAGLRVTAHVNTSADFHHAITAGVDEIAHLPGVAQAEIIRQADADQAAAQGTVVITTLSLTTNIADDYPKWYEAVMAQHGKNLARLHEAGVTIAVGSDFPYRDTSAGEAMLLHGLGVFSNLELLQMWAVNAPKTIFPERRIGCLEAGCEASFLVLNRNPLEDFPAVRDIHARYKQGALLDIAPPPADEH